MQCMDATMTVDSRQTVLRFYSHRTNNEMAAWDKQLQRTNFKGNKSNHFAGGYRRDTCEKPILYMKGYPDEGNNVKARENTDTKGKRKQHSKPDSKQFRDSYLKKESD